MLIHILLMDLKETCTQCTQVRLYFILLLYAVSVIFIQPLRSCLNKSPMRRTGIEEFLLSSMTDDDENDGQLYTLD